MPDGDLSLPSVALPEGDSIAGWAPGSLICEMPAERYHAHRDHLSQSQMADVLRSPAHYWAALHEPSRPQTPSQRIGSALHAALLEPERYAREFVTWDGYRRGKAWDEFEAAHAGHEILTSAERERITGMAEAVLNFREINLRAVLRGGRTELSLFWSDPASRVRCKARLDAYLDGLILDLKTTDDARPHAFSANALRLGYDVQAAHYVDGVAQCFGPGVCTRFAFVAVEVEAPYSVWVYHVHGEALERGRARAQAARNLVAYCREMNEWPGYEAPISQLMLPAWAINSLA